LTLIAPFMVKYRLLSNGVITARDAGAPYGDEIDVPSTLPVDFSEWLETISTVEIWTLQQLLDAFNFKEK